ncbi:MAG: SRPBCC family protein [Acidimicrobiales bacterium]
MRYSDGPTAEVEILIEATKSEVWALISDPAMPASFSNELEVAAWQDPETAPGVGSIIEGHNKNPRVGEWDTLSYVSRWEPQECFEWKVGDPSDPFATWRFELADGNADSANNADNAESADNLGNVTLLRQWCTIGPARSGVSVAIDARPDLEEEIVENRMTWHRQNMLHNLEGVRGKLEDPRFH